MIAYLLALLATLTASLACDPALTALFTPPKPSLGRYEVCTTPDSLENVAAGAGPRFGPNELLEPLDAFGAAGPYNRAALTRLYAGRRVRVARGWIEYADRFESVTLLSPYPDATLTGLLEGTMVITWTMSR
jgi:hypothetical protein